MLQDPDPVRQHLDCTTFARVTDTLHDKSTNTQKQIVILTLQLPLLLRNLATRSPKGTTVYMKELRWLLGHNALSHFDPHY